MKRLLATLFLGGGILCGASLTASAAPLVIAPITAKSQVEQVHGYHRSCRRGHRNVRGGIVRCGPRYYRGWRPGFSVYIGPRYRGWRYGHWRGHRHHYRGGHRRHHR